MENDSHTPELIIHGVGTFTPPDETTENNPTTSDDPRYDNKQENN